MRKLLLAFILLIPFITSGAQVVTHDYDFIGKPGSHGPPWILVEKNGKVGFIDEDWKPIVPVDYDHIEPFRYITRTVFPGGNRGIRSRVNINITINNRQYKSSKGWEIEEVTDYTYAVVKKGNRYGAIDTTGKLILQVEYDSIGKQGGFSSNGALIVKDGKWGAISLAGSIIAEPQYDEPIRSGTFAPNSAIVVKDGKKGVISSSGNILIRPEYDEIKRSGTFTPNSAIVVKNGKKGVISSSGNILIRPEYDEINRSGTFTANSAIVVKDGKKGVISNSGNMLIRPEYDEIKRSGTFTPNSAIVVKNGKKGVISNSGNMLIKPEYDEIRKPGSFSPTSAVIVRGGKQGVVSSSGNIILEPQFDKVERIGTAGQSMALVKSGDKYGVVNSSGKVTVKAEYDSIGKFTHYRSAVTPSKGTVQTTGSVDRVVTRTLRLPFIKITWTERFGPTSTYYPPPVNPAGMLAVVKKGNRYGYINTQGKEVVPVKYRTISEIDIDSYLNHQDAR